MIITALCYCGLKYQYYDWEKMDHCISCQLEIKKIGLLRGSRLIASQKKYNRERAARKNKAAKFYYTANTGKINARRRQLRNKKKEMWQIEFEKWKKA